jgi:4a-hydroxytetrahydrobiopterin dehydratase
VDGENVNNMKIIITESQKNRIMNSANWEEVSGKLIKTFYFKDYKKVMSFVSEVMEIANKQNHHPDMTVHYDNVKLSITDHDKGKVSDKCHKFVNEVNKIK